nr:hypothetical protein [uncultured Noviherbaspirillum sp.]
MTATAAGSLAQRRDVPPAGRWPAGTLWILGRVGRAHKLQWHADRHDEAAGACAVFDQHCGRGYRAFLIGACRPARSVTRFDPGHAQIVLVPGPSAGWEDSGAEAWTESLAEAGGLLRSWLGGLLRGPALPASPIRRQLRANRESLALLLRVLSTRQRQSLRDTGSFMLLGGASGLRYRIRSTGEANIDQLDAHGAVEYRLRIAPACELALPGWLLMQVLHLQDPETEYPFLAAAQVFPARG